MFTVEKRNAVLCRMVKVNEESKKGLQKLGAARKAFLFF